MGRDILGGNYVKKKKYDRMTGTVLLDMGLGT